MSNDSVSKEAGGSGAEDLRRSETAVRQTRAVASLMRGFNFVHQWATRRDLDGVESVAGLTNDMESLADVLVLDVRTDGDVEEQGVVAERQAEMDRLTEAIDSIVPAGNDAGEAEFDSVNIEPLLPHIDGFPLAVHDLRNRLTPVQGYGRMISSKRVPEELIDEASASLACAWDDVTFLASESLNFLRNPASTREISLEQVFNVINRSAYSQASALGLPIHVNPFEESIDRQGFQINFSTYLLRSIIANAAQNTLRAALNRQEHPELAVRLLAEGDAAGAVQTLTIELHDNAGGFSESFLENRIPGYFSPESQAASRNIAIRSIESFIEGAGGIITYDNQPYRQNTDQIGARIRISFPVVSSRTS